MKFSYIVAIYNTSKYLRRCLDSLVGQTYSNVEIILVNDGSTDTSPEICLEYKEKYPNIVYVEKPNGGLSDARNCGLSYANGDYVIFVDSDDYCELTQCEDLSKCLGKLPDICTYGYYNDFDSQNITKEFCFDKYIQRGSYKLFANSELSKAVEYIDFSQVFNTVWNKAYNRSFISENGLLFDIDGMPGEDLLFNVEAFIKSKSACILNKPLYHYLFQDEITLSRKYRADLYERNLSFCKARKKLYDYFELNSADSKQAYALAYVQYMFVCIPNSFRLNAPKSFKSRKEIFIRLKSNNEFLELLSEVKNSDTQFKLLNILLKLGANISCLAYSTIMFVRNKMNRVYNKIRTRKYKKSKGYK